MSRALPRMRPRFQLTAAASADCVIEHLVSLVQRSEKGFRLQVRGHFADLRVPAKAEHLFSPTLLVAVEKAGENRSRLYCRLAPHPNVWTGLMALYGVIALAGTAGLMYGLAQLTLDRPPWALLALPGSLALIASVYGAVFVGQGLGASQMVELRHVLDEALERAETAPTPASQTPAPQTPAG